MRKIWFTGLLLNVCICFSTFAQSTLAVLPFQAKGIDSVSAETAGFILKQEILKSGKYRLSPNERILNALSGKICVEVDCAVEIGRKLEADQVVFGAFNKLGEKLIVQYSLVDVLSGDILMIDNMTATYVEDLDVVMERIAASITDQKPVEKTAEVGLVTEEESWEPRSRKFKTSFGVSFGYAYPNEGYDESDRVFALDFRTIYEIRHLALTGLLGVRRGLILNVGGLYLFSPKDHSAYIGGGVGVHVVHHNSYLYNRNVQLNNDDEGFIRTGDEKQDGFGVLLNGGLMAFRTYNFRIMLNLEYNMTFNDYKDKALVFTIGILNNK